MQCGLDVGFHALCVAGSNEHVVRARERAAQLPGALELLKGLVADRVTSRWQPEQALGSEMFEGLELDGADMDDECESYMHYL